MALQPSPQLIKLLELRKESINVLHGHHIFWECGWSAKNGTRSLRISSTPPFFATMWQHFMTFQLRGSGGGASGWRQLFDTLLLAYILRLICELCTKWRNPDLDTSQWYCSTVVCCGTAFLGSFRWTLYYSHTRANILRYILTDSRFNLFFI